MSRTSDKADKSNKNILSSYNPRNKKNKTKLINKVLFNKTLFLSVFCTLGQFSAASPPKKMDSALLPNISNKTVQNTSQVPSKSTSILVDSNNLNQSVNQPLVSLESSGSHQMPAGMSPLKLHSLPTLSSKLPGQKSPAQLSSKLSPSKSSVYQLGSLQFEDSFNTNVGKRVNNSSLSNIAHVQSFYDPLQVSRNEVNNNEVNNSSLSSTSNIGKQGAKAGSYLLDVFSSGSSVYNSMYDNMRNSIRSNSVRSGRSNASRAKAEPSRLIANITGVEAHKDAVSKDTVSLFSSAQKSNRQSYIDSDSSSNNISNNTTMTNSPQHGPLHGNNAQETNTQEINASLLSTSSTTAQNLSISLTSPSMFENHSKSADTVAGMSTMVESDISVLLRRVSLSNRLIIKALYDEVDNGETDKIIEKVEQIHGQSLNDNEVLFLSIINEVFKDDRISDKKKIWESLDPAVRNSDRYLMHVKSNGYYMHLSGDDWRIKTVIQRDLYGDLLRRDSVER